MGIKRLEDFNQDVETAKEVLSSMPINNAKNLALYLNKVRELKEEYSIYRDDVLDEIKKRSAKYLSYTPNDRMELVKKELLDYKDFGLFNPINTPFEKMGFDTLLYSLTHYYKNDLPSVNNDIKEALEKFELVGVTLTEKDFVYSNYARKYIKELLRDDSEDRMKDVFEDLHWKCPDVISHIETSLRILFDKNVKLFENYLAGRRKEILIDNLSYDDYLLKRNNLAKELYDLENYDEKAIINKFMEGKLMLNDYSVISVNKCYSKFLGDNCDIGKAKEKNGDFKNLLFNLEEYQNYMRYSYVLDDVKAKYAEKDSHQGELVKLTKEINAIVMELEKLTDEVNEGATKGFWIFKKKIDIEKHYLTINEKVKELDLKYEEYDKAVVFEKMNQHISETSSVYDVFKFVYSFKGYLRSCIKTHEEDVDINKIKKIVKYFDEFLSNPNLNILRNVKFSVDNDLSVILIDHYKMLGINIKPDSLESESIEDLIKSLKIILNSYYFEEAGLNIEFIMDLFESKKLIEMYK
jgi:hypothetical protein